MSNEIDETLVALFSKPHESLPSSEFMRSFLAKMQRARRRQKRRRIALIAACGVFAAWIIPPVLSNTAALMQFVGEPSLPYGELIISPAGWAISMLIGILVLLRTGALRRR